MYKEGLKLFFSHAGWNLSLSSWDGSQAMTAKNTRLLVLLRQMLWKKPQVHAQVHVQLHAYF